MIRRGIVSHADNLHRTASVFFPDLDRGVAVDIPIAAGVPDLAARDIVFVGHIHGLIDAVVLAKHSTERLPGEPSEPLGAVAAHNESADAHALLFGRKADLEDGRVPAEQLPALLALGETSATAYRGDRGTAAYDHSMLTAGNPHQVSKGDVGLGNADNTSDVNKPVSTATQVALDGKADLSDGKILASQLPSYVDDVLDYDNLAAFPATGEIGKIYIAKDTNVIYRWSGTGYVEISASLALGETAATAYRGDRGKTAYDHSQATGNPHNLQISDLFGSYTPWHSGNDVGVVAKAYPIGSIYINVLSTNPHDLLGFGTWVAFATGRMLIGVDPGDASMDAALDTGGAKTHTISQAELPSFYSDVVTLSGFGVSIQSGTNQSRLNVQYTGVGGDDGAGKTQIHSGGSNQPYNNLPPYIAVYIWRRTA